MTPFIAALFMASSASLPVGALAGVARLRRPDLPPYGWFCLLAVFAGLMSLLESGMYRAGTVGAFSRIPGRCPRPSSRALCSFRSGVPSSTWTIPITFSVEETFDVGEDTGSPVIEDVYAVPFRSEHLEQLTLRLGSD
jgi:hypothetical protein